MDQKDYELSTRCGYVSLVGRPNVGKSTLMNHLLGQKISITSRKPQTTRQQIMGIDTLDDVQIVYVDTPGMHRDAQTEMNRLMNRSASDALNDVDVVVFVVDKLTWTDEDEMVLEKLKHAKIPVVLAINKIDQIADKASLLPYLTEVQKKMDFAEIIPISALKNSNLDQLRKIVGARLPKSLFFFPEDQITTKTERFLAAEMVREKLMRQLGDELPYSTAVEIEEFKFDGRVLHIHALILVERSGQKRIVIGDHGSRIKLVGEEARKDMEALFGAKVMLNTWVKVKSGWSDDQRALRSLGMFDDFDKM